MQAASCSPGDIRQLRRRFYKLMCIYDPAYIISYKKHVMMRLLDEHSAVNPVVNEARR